MMKTVPQWQENESIGVDLSMDGTDFPQAENQELLFLSFLFGTLKVFISPCYVEQGELGVGREADKVVAVTE